MGFFPLHPLSPHTAQCPGTRIPPASGTPPPRVSTTREISAFVCVFSPSLNFRKAAGSFKLLMEDMNPKGLFSCLVFLFLRWKTISSADNSGLRVSFIAVTKQCPWPRTLMLPCGLGSWARLHLPPTWAGPCRCQRISPSRLRIEIAFTFCNYNKEGPN